MAKLGDILKDVDYKLESGSLAAEVMDVHYDSRECAPGSLFFCIPGYNVDGHDFAPEAYAKGATTFIASRSLGLKDVNVVIVDDPRKAMGLISAAFYGHPDRAMNLAGVSGTNGKTSIAFLIDALHRKAGIVSGMLGTVENRIANEVLAVKRTTPESLDLHSLLWRMEQKSCTHAVMEVSSHAIYLKRIAGCLYNVAIFSNLTQDHLDFHPDLESYFNVKKELFTDYMAEDGVAVINVDDEKGRELAEQVSARTITYGIENENADVRAVDVKCPAAGIRFKVKAKGREDFEVKSAICGKFNVYNALAMIGYGISQDITSTTIASTLADVKGVPGRFEKIEAGQDFTVVVDYAHSPDGIENVLAAAREICDGKLIVVFGAGGDRDKAKRPLMGDAAARLSDIAVITSDNPRSEEPEEIIDQIVNGVKQGMLKLDKLNRFKYFEEIDRFSGIKKAIELAEKNDVVVIAGKGHEDYQIFKDRTIHFDDREVAENIIKNRNGQ